MRNLLQFLWKYHFVLLYLLVQSFAFVLLVGNNSVHRSNFFSGLNEVSGNAFAFVNQTREYVRLKEVNESLSQENAVLKANQQESYKTIIPQVFLVDDSLAMRQYEYLSARNINSTTNKRNNYLTLDEGTDNGVQASMGVISDRGVVGIVKSTSTHFSSVISVLHKNTSISSKLKKNEYFGILTWDGRDPKVAQLDDIPSHVKLNPGDTVVTRGSGTIFPPGVLVGTVRDFEPIAGTDFYSINVNLAVDFKRVSYVYLVKNQLKLEQLELEENNEEADDQ